MPHEIRADLERFVALPSVGAESLHRADVDASAHLVAEAFHDIGVPVDVVSAGGGPAVIGRREGPPGAPTVLLYAHHDVQPAGSGWTSDPFSLTERDGRWFGRGTADDKGGIAAHLAALRALGDRPPVSIAVLIEGEEEVGSPTLTALLADHLETVRADVVLAPDAVNAGPLVPSLTVALRGLVSLVVTVRTADRALHSGIHGGAVPDALGALVRALDALTDDDGCCAVPGLANDGASEELRAPDEAQLRAALRPGVRLLGRGSTAARTVNGPAVTVTGIDAPGVDGAANVLVPQARAAVSVRLPPEMDPDAAAIAVEKHLRRAVPWGAELTVECVATGRGWRARPSAAAELGAAALAEAFGAPTVEIGVGGSIPFIPALARMLPDAEMLVTAVQDPGTGAHGADESVDPRALVAAARAEALIMARLGELRV